LSAVRSFARYLSAIDPRTEIPPQGLLPYRTQRAKPYIYSDEQIRQLLEAAQNMPATHSLQPWTYHCLFGLLAVTGLRISEALNLRVTDVDFTDGILTIRHSKFGKSRLIPLHRSSIKILSEYGVRRDRLFTHRKSPYFFCTRCDGRLDEGQVRRTFYKSPVRLAFEKLQPAADRDCMTFVIVSQWRRYCAGIETATTFSGGCRSYPLIWVTHTLATLIGI
jgi:integrase